MCTIEKITKTYIRLYSDTGQLCAYAEWVDSNGKKGRTQGDLSSHSPMRALLERGKREGVIATFEQW